MSLVGKLVFCSWRYAYVRREPSPNPNNDVVCTLKENEIALIISESSIDRQFRILTLNGIIGFIYDCDVEKL